MEYRVDRIQPIKKLPVFAPEIRYSFILRDGRTIIVTAVPPKYLISIVGTNSK